jgi:CrcB protein
VGCFIIGFLSQLAESRGVLTAEMRALIIPRFLGGLTTFSTFSNETLNLFRDSESLLAYVNIAAHLVLGLGAVWLGNAVAFAIWR